LLNKKRPGERLRGVLSKRSWSNAPIVQGPEEREGALGGFGVGALLCGHAGGTALFRSSGLGVSVLRLTELSRESGD